MVPFSKGSSALTMPTAWRTEARLCWACLLYTSRQIMTIDRDVWQQEILSHEELFLKLYNRLPKELHFIRELTISSLWRAPEHWEVKRENA